MNALKYRSDVDGLRAVAVIAVVAFHMGGEDYLPGGFTGVDIFFVISGFIITRLLKLEIEGGTFSIINFYLRRIKRIFPAILVVILTTLTLSWFLLMPGDYEIAASSAIYTLGFISNWFFLKNINYFSPTADTMPLLHTWSLSVEEQFYIFWPILLFTLLYVFHERRGLLLVLLALALAGLFSYSQYLAIDEPSRAFYLAQARAWQLLMGGLIALGADRFLTNLAPALYNTASLLGSAAIATGLAYVNIEEGYSGNMAVLPTIGSALIIIGGHGPGSIVQTALSNPVALFFGRISYSLYLWHWPILVFYLHYSVGQAPSGPVALTLVALSVGAATLSYYFVEQPIRKANVTWRRVYTMFFVASASTAALAYLIVLGGGIADRLVPEAQQMLSLKQMWDWKCPENKQFKDYPDLRCRFGAPWDSARHHGVLWGDSNAKHFAPLLDIVGRDLGISFVLQGGCLPYLGNNAILDHRLGEKGNKKCKNKVQKTLEWLKARPEVDVVVLAASWTSYPKTLYTKSNSKRSKEHGMELMSRGLDHFFAEVLQSHRNGILLGKIPHIKRRSVDCAHSGKSGLIRKDCEIKPALYSLQCSGKKPIRRQCSYADVLSVLRGVAERNPEVNYMSILDKFCPSKKCMNTLNGEFLYRDGGHIRRNLKESTYRQLVEILGLNKLLEISNK